jgi:hypothetical protein
VRTAPVRGALEHFYRPLVRSYFDEAHWAQLPESVRRELFSQTIQQIWDHVLDAANEGKLDGQDESMAWVDFELDQQGLEEVNAEIDKLLERALDIQSKAYVRLAKLDGEERVAETRRTELAVMHFHRAGKTRITASKPRKKRAKS